MNTLCFSTTFLVDLTHRFGGLEAVSTVNKFCQKLWKKHQDGEHDGDRGGEKERDGTENEGKSGKISEPATAAATTTATAATTTTTTSVLFVSSGPNVIQPFTSVIYGCSLSLASLSSPV
jgi:hypothetical protein